MRQQMLHELLKQRLPRTTMRSVQAAMRRSSGARAGTRPVAVNVNRAYVCSWSNRSSFYAFFWAPTGQVTGNAGHDCPRLCIEPSPSAAPILLPRLCPLPPRHRAPPLPCLPSIHRVRTVHLHLLCSALMLCWTATCLRLAHTRGGAALAHVTYGLDAMDLRVTNFDDQETASPLLNDGDAAAAALGLAPLEPAESAARLLGLEAEEDDAADVAAADTSDMEASSSDEDAADGGSEGGNQPHNKASATIEMAAAAPGGGHGAGAAASPPELPVAPDELAGRVPVPDSDEPRAPNSGRVESFVVDLEEALREALEDRAPLTPLPVAPAVAADDDAKDVRLSAPDASAARSDAGAITAGAPSSARLASVRRRLVPEARRARRDSARGASIIDAPWEQPQPVLKAQADFLAEARYMRRWLESTVGTRVHPRFVAEAFTVQRSLYDTFASEL